MQYILDRIIYFAFIFYILLCAVIEHFFEKKSKWIAPLLIASILIIYSILGIIRGPNVGFDTYAYTKMYNEDVFKYPNFIKYLIKRKPEFIFYGLMYIFSLMQIPEFIFRAVIYLTISTCLFFSFYKKRNGIIMLEMFFALGFFALSYTGVRQCLAVAIILLAVNYYINYSKTNKKKALLIFYILNFLAILNHETAIIMLFTPLLLSIKYPEDIILSPLILLPFLPSLASGIIRYCFVEFGIEYSISTSRVSYLFILTLIVFILYYMICLHKHSREWLVKIKIIDKDIENIYEPSNMIIELYMMMIFTVINFVTQIFTRFAMFFYIFLIFTIFEIINKISNQKIKKIIYFGVTLFFAIYFIYGLKVGGVVPYAI